jgi:hypothetical protein
MADGLGTARAGDRDHPWGLSEHPGQGDLLRRRPGLLSDPLKRRETDLEVGGLADSTEGHPAGTRCRANRRAEARVRCACPRLWCSGEPSRRLGSAGAVIQSAESVGFVPAQAAVVAAAVSPWRKAESRACAPFLPPLALSAPLLLQHALQSRDACTCETEAMPSQREGQGFESP